MGSLSLRFPDRRGLALSVHGVGASVGDSLGPVIVGAILAVASWRVVIEYHLWPAVLIALLLWHGIRNDSVPAQDDSGASFRSYVSGIRDLVTNRQVLAVMLANALVNMARLAVMAFLPIYLKETLGFTAFTLGVFLSLLYVMGVVSQPAMGVLSDQFGRKVVLLPSSVAMGVLYLAIPFAGAGALLGIVIAALGMFFYPILNVMQAAIMDVADPGVQGSTMSVMSLFTQPFVLVSPVLAGFLVSAYGMESAFWYASAAALLSAVVLALVRLRRTV
jgi:predicted MFS family arabinose efflux permease